MIHLLDCLLFEDSLYALYQLRNGGVGVLSAVIALKSQAIDLIEDQLLGCGSCCEAQIRHVFQYDRVSQLGTRW